MKDKQNVVFDNKTEYSKDIDDLLYLLTSAVNSRSPGLAQISKMNVDLIYNLASYHSVVAIVAFALECAIDLPHKYDQAKKKAIRKQALFDTERNKIFSYFSKEGIWYMPLKGVVIKEYYPKFGMREMVDNDVLCDPNHMEDVKVIMEDLGFHCDLFGVDNQDVYSKDILCFEVHNSLFQADKYSDFSEYYKDIKTKLICDQNNSYEYRFKTEDLYIYLTAHEYKHYSRGGTGLRSLLDTYLFLKHYKAQMDWCYVNGELEKLKLTEFEKMNRQLSEKVFSEIPLSNEEKQLLMYYVSSGAHGTEEHRVDNRISSELSENDSKISKQRYITNRVFLRGEELKSKHPFVYQHKVLLPFFYVYRLFNALFTRPKKVWEEFWSVVHFNNNK